MDTRHFHHWLHRRKERREGLSLQILLKGLLNGNHEALSTSITLIESTRTKDRQRAAELISQCIPFCGNSIRIGITGVPGVGKSTLIERLGQLLVNQGKRVAVLAIDPTSVGSGGSILGDKTRMPQLSVLKNVFIRPTASGGVLGGVARKTRECIFLCETAGFDVILVETVGVGQSETLVHSMVDFFVLLMLAGAGDELQGMKRGIMEMADVLVITKADGINEKQAQIAKNEYANALHLFPPRANKRTPRVFTVSAIENKRIDRVWECLQDFHSNAINSGYLELHRKEQNKFWLHETLKELLLEDFFSFKEVTSALEIYERCVQNGEMSTLEAAEYLYKLYRKKMTENEINDI